MSRGLHLLYLYILKKEYFIRKQAPHGDGIVFELRNHKDGHWVCVYLEPQ